MYTLTRPETQALKQLSARTTLPVPSRLAVQVAWLFLIWSQRRQSRCDLARLDSHLLRDIGLTAEDAFHESRKWFWRS
ncbi:DUF1127 domain-containing protein [Roseovarius aestuariivivens]|uniref:DUF1127 domain-containing protein n=1 Tax=Roseovarius aestuariivivens TaxID=1888910 RepID=UPI001080D40B|nr:DUF1127 domain-containing protein [Roseovarius aestuariivivens]